MTDRREALGSLAGLGLLAILPLPVLALATDNPIGPALLPSEMLNSEQSDHFRAWMAFIILDQIQRGPSKRWFHRDCAGLVRFAVSETLREHDSRWRRASGFEGQRLPPELKLTQKQAALRNRWITLDNDHQAFVTALALIQKNSQLLGRESAMARPGDLLFFDQGNEQHLMVWMGNWIAYHTGQEPRQVPLQGNTKQRTQKTIPEDNGLRAVTPAQLLQWKDTRWRIRNDNPNFAGFYRLAFLSR